MTSTINRTVISRQVFEFVMKLLRETLGTTGRYLDLMRRNAPLRIQKPLPQSINWGGTMETAEREFYRGVVPRSAPSGSTWGLSDIFLNYQGFLDGVTEQMRVVNLPTGSYHLTRSEHISEVRSLERMWQQVGIKLKRLSQRAAWHRPDAYGTFVPFRHTYNASRII